MSNFKRCADGHFIYEICCVCGEELPFSFLRATDLDIESSKADHVCKLAVAA